MYSKGEKAEKIYLIYIKAILRGWLISLALLLAVTLLFYFTGLSNDYIGLAAWIITVIAICYSGIYASFTIGSKGLIHGVIIGAVFICTLMAIALIAEGGELNMMSYGVMLLVGIVIGGLSGIIGTLINKG